MRKERLSLFALGHRSRRFLTPVSAGTCKCTPEKARAGAVPRRDTARLPVLQAAVGAATAAAAAMGDSELQAAARGGPLLAGLFTALRHRAADVRKATNLALAHISQVRYAPSPPPPPARPPHAALGRQLCCAM